MATPCLVSLANSNTYSQVGSATAVSSFTTAVDVSPGYASVGQAFQVQPGQLYPGQQWRFTANGTWSSTSSPGVSLGVYYGGAAGSPLCYGSVAAASAFTNCASIPWTLQAMGKVTTVGPSTAVWDVVGFLTGLQPVQVTPVTGAATSPSAITPMPNYTPNSPFDSASAHVISLAATCGSSSASNIMQVHNWTIEYMTEP